MRVKSLLRLIVLVVFLSAGFALIAQAYGSFPREQLISLISNGADSLASGDTASALGQLLEAKGMLSSQIAALSPGESTATLDNLAFSIEGADRVAEYNSVWQYYAFDVYLQISNLSSEVVDVSLDTIGGISIDGFAISPDGKQLEDNFLFDFDYLLPGVDKDVAVGFVIGLDSHEEFVPGDYTIMIRLGPVTGRPTFLKAQFTIQKGQT